MIKQSISYVDYNGENQTEDFYFNLSKAEILEMMVADENIVESLQNLAKNGTATQAMNWFKDLIQKSVGEKSEDGKRFVKSPEITKNFMESPAFSEFLFDIIQNPAKSEPFVQGLLPNDVLAAMQTEIEGEKAVEFANKSEAARALSERNMQGFKKKEAPKKEAPKNPAEMSTEELEALLARRKGESTDSQ